MILFDEFCNWAISKDLDLEDDNDPTPALELKVQSKFEAGRTPKSPKISPPRGIDLKAISSRRISERAEQISKRRAGDNPEPLSQPPESEFKVLSTEVWQTLAEKVPWRKTAQDKAKRQELFASLATVSSRGEERMVSRDALQRGFKIILKCEELFDPAVVIDRALETIKTHRGQEHEHHDDDSCSFKEFRLLCWYIRHYFEYWVIFELIDASHDHRIDLSEFKNAAQHVAKLGLPPMNLTEAFAKIAGSDNLITYDEFCAWGLEQQLENHLFVNADGDDESFEEDAPVTPRRKNGLSKKGKKSNSSGKSSPKSNKKSEKTVSPKIKPAPLVVFSPRTLTNPKQIAQQNFGSGPLNPTRGLLPELENEKIMKKIHVLQQRYAAKRSITELRWVAAISQLPDPNFVADEKSSPCFELFEELLNQSDGSQDVLSFDDVENFIISSDIHMDMRSGNVISRAFKAVAQGIH